MLGNVKVLQPNATVLQTKKASDYPARFKQTANRTQTDSALCAW